MSAIDGVVTSETCARWIALSDREALGEALDPEETAFARDHLASCTACREEAAVFAGLSALVDGTDGHDGRAAPPAQERLARPPTAPLPPREAPHLLQEGPPARAWPWMVTAAVAACAAAAAIVIAQRGSEAPAPSATDPQRAPKAAEVVLAMTSGRAVEIDGRAATVGQRLRRGELLFAREGSACLVLEPSVRACVARGTLLRIADAGPQRRIELLGGTISAELDPQPRGTNFGITTRDGTAIAVGTAFSVEVPPGDGPVVTRVSHGTVLVRPLAGAEQRVNAHEMTSMRSARPTTLPAVEEERDRALLVTTPMHEEQTSPVRIDSDIPGAIVTVDARVVGATPVALLLTRGDHAVTVEAPAHATVHETLHVGREVLERRFVLAASPAPPPVGPPASVANDAPRSAPTLLAAARERRASGDFDGSIAAYRELLDRHGSSAEAHTALVPFGELQLARLSDARGALQSFDRYLALGGPLEQEASFGRVRALRALGRAADERAAIDTFLGRFPDGPLASSLRERRKVLEDR